LGLRKPRNTLRGSKRDFSHSIKVDSKFHLNSIIAGNVREGKKKNQILKIKMQKYIAKCKNGFLLAQE